MEDFIDNHFVLSIITFTFGLLLVVGIPVTLLFYYSACQQAAMYDRLHGATFSCSDFFWAGDQINSRTQTIELNK